MAKKRLEAIKANIEKPKGKRDRQFVSRGDVIDLLEHYGDPKKEKENVRGFLDTLSGSIVDGEKKHKIVDDLQSYQHALSYRKHK